MEYSKEQAYHNTLLLLRQYRAARWNLEMGMAQIRESSPMDFDLPLEEQLHVISDLGVSYYGKPLEQQADTLQLTWQMLQLIDRSVHMMRSRHPKGELYYQILYLNFLSEEGSLPTAMLLDTLKEHGFYMSNRSYFRHKKAAIDLLGSILWGYTTRDCLQLLQQYVERLQYE
ncbi:MAG: hypothetical protein IJV50_00450 [Lachnospiraceae bacterium]|nr:hypothetical protein [Lachnospiraceae bacterium]